MDIKKDHRGDIRKYFRESKVFTWTQEDLRYEHFAFRLKSSFSPVVKTTSDGKQSVLTLL